MILFKADPLEGQISLFSCILVAKERKKQKKRVKEKERNHVIITLTCMYSIKCFEKFFCLHFANFKVLVDISTAPDESFHKD